MFKDLPKYKGIKRKIVAGEQTTDQIINEVLEAHNFFAGDYIALAEYFGGLDEYSIGKKLFNFCKKNIKYKIEGVNEQSTRSAAAILRLGHGDCKHYAGFIAGVLDALNRVYKKNIDWVYRFASYDPLDKTPVHVFVVIKTSDMEIWVDPVLETFDSRKPFPAYYIDKKPKKMLYRISGATLPTISNLYDKAASNATALDGLVTSSIPFYGLAKGLLTSFFGKGGISDWLSPTGILNELKFALFGRQYRGGQYWLGEKFRYYVMGEDIHSRDADIVTDPAVLTAMTVFSTGFGVPIEDFQDIINLQAGRQAYIKRYVALGALESDINVLAVDRAVTLKQEYFPFSEVSKGPPPNKWDPNNFNKIPFVVPIPDFTASYSQMWRGTYTGPIPGGEVINGVVITGKLSEAGKPIVPGSAAAGGMNTWLIIGAVAIGGYFLLKKRR